MAVTVSQTRAECSWWARVAVKVWVGTGAQACLLQVQGQLQAVLLAPSWPGIMWMDGSSRSSQEGFAGPFSLAKGS